VVATALQHLRLQQVMRDIIIIIKLPDQAIASTPVMLVIMLLPGLLPLLP
jgi:hypothetical protein